MRWSERGVGTVLTAGLAACMTVVAGASCLCIGWFSAVRQAERVAEVAALAGASAAVQGQDPCSAAKKAVQRNGGTLQGCVVRGNGANVVVEVSTIARLEPNLGLVPATVERQATAATL